MACVFLFRHRSKGQGAVRFVAGTALIILGAATLLALTRAGGGWAGAVLARLLEGSLGGFGAFGVAIALLLYAAQTVFGLHFTDTARWTAALARISDWLRYALLAAKPAGPAKTASPPPPASYHLPPLELLRPPSKDSHRPPAEELAAGAAALERAFEAFDIDAQVSAIRPGPVITRYEVSPGAGATVSSIVARANDIALTMRAKGIRMVAPIPGKAAIGIEIPNAKCATVGLREVLESQALAGQDSPLAFALGLSSDGTPLAADLQTMPHVLVAGATNSGKSVMAHALIASLLFRQRPDRVKLLLIDPKRIELCLYEGIPHLYDPTTPPGRARVLTSAGQAAAALRALVGVMEDRYERFQARKVRNIGEYNRTAAAKGEPAEPFIVVVIDELADLMVVARDSVEDSILRLAQMARAVGIHLVLCTQRPSVDVVTGVIKANLPSRIAMHVASKVDSKVVIDQNGAEALLGRGDALYLAPGQEPLRFQGALVSPQEIGALVEYWEAQGRPDRPPSAKAVLDESAAGFPEFRQAMKLVPERERRRARQSGDGPSEDVPLRNERIDKAILGLGFAYFLPRFAFGLDPFPDMYLVIPPVFVAGCMAKCALNLFKRPARGRPRAISPWVHGLGTGVTGLLAIGISVYIDALDHDLLVYLWISASLPTRLYLPIRWLVLAALATLAVSTLEVNPRLEPPTME